jgi:hypothetical protein
MFNDLTGRISCIFSLIFPIHLYYVFGVNAESMAYVGCIVALYGFSRWYAGGYQTWYRSGGWWLLFTGIASLLLARPNLILIMPLIVGALMFMYIFHRETYRKLYRPTFMLVLFLAGLFFSVATVVRQLPGKRDTKKQQDYLIYVMQHGRFQYREEPFDWRFWDDSNREGSRDYQAWIQSEKELHSLISDDKNNFREVYTNWIIEDVKNNKLLFLKQFAMRTLSGQFMFVNSVTPGNFKLLGFQGKVYYYIFHVLLNMINIIILICTFIFLFREKRRLPEFWVLWVPLLAIIFFHASIYMEPRYVFPGRACLLLMASYIFGQLYLRARHRFIKKDAEKNESHKLSNPS